MAVYGDPADDDIRAKHRVDLPHRRIHYRDAFDEDVSATIGLNEVRAQKRPLAEYALRHGSAVHAEIHQASSCRRSLSRPIPPQRVACLTIESAGASDGDVLFVKGIDERGVVHQ